MPEAAQTDRKLNSSKSNADNVVAVGNGRNDRKMLEAAAIGIALFQREGSAVKPCCAPMLLQRISWMRWRFFSVRSAS